MKIKDKRSIQISVLIEKINYLLENEEYAYELGKRGRKIFLEKYELKNFRDKILNLYKNV